MENLTLLAVGLITVAIGVGAVIGYFVRQAIAKKQAGTAEAKLNELILNSKREARETLITAKDQAVKILEEAKIEEKKRRDQLIKLENFLVRREGIIDKKEGEVDRGAKNLKRKKEEIDTLKKEAESVKDQQLKTLESLSQLSKDEAKNVLLASIEEKSKEELLERIKKITRSNQEEIERKAKEFITLAIQRCATSHAAEITTTVVGLPSDDMKGRIIGKEGRNIRTLERLTGVEVIVDDTPEAIIISGFDPIRRQVAKISLEYLLADGRIQPARIEEIVEKAKNEISLKVKEAGEAAVYDTGVLGLDPKLVYLLGRLRFRTSYGQNVLLHSMEAAHIAGSLAAELGLDVAVAKRGALLHDIGKSVDHEIQGSHIEIGINILKKFSIDEKTIQAMKSHHGDYPFETPESLIVQAAEAISAARPGARKDTVENYIKRLEDLEGLANSFDGVEKSYAIQAGREIRVFVKPEKIDDLAAIKLAQAMAGRIEEELKYPGEIKVNIIRETRAVEYAR